MGSGKRTFTDMERTPDASTVPNTQPIMFETPLGSPTQLNTQRETSVEEAAGLSSTHLDRYLSDSNVPADITTPHSKNPSVSGSLCATHSQSLEAMRGELHGLSQRVDDILALLNTQATRRDSLRDPQRGPIHHRMRILQKHASAFDVDDWISAAQSELHSRPRCADNVAVTWALSYVADEIQDDWFHHLPTLWYDAPETDVKLGDFWQFIRGERREPNLFAHSYRSQLHTLYQLDSESPARFFARWRSHQLRVKPNMHLRGPDRVDLAYHYYFRLHERLRRRLLQRNVRLENAYDICDEAEAIWVEWQEERRQCSLSNILSHSDVESITGDWEAAQLRIRCSNCGRRGHSTAGCRISRRRR